MSSHPRSSASIKLRSYAELLQERKRLLTEIRYAEQHFLASLSEPVSAHLHDLMRQEAYLLCELIQRFGEK